MKNKTMPQLVQEVLFLTGAPLTRAIDYTCAMYNIAGEKRQDLINGVMEFIKLEGQKLN